MNEALLVVIALVCGLVLGALLLYFFVLRRNQEELSVLRQEHLSLGGEHARKEVLLEASVKELEHQKQEIDQLNEKLTKEFENIANKVVHQSSKQMQERHEERLMALLNPFKERIEKFEQKVEETHKESIRENSTLKEQISQLKTLNQTIGDEARNLTAALKGDKKMQGDWGEQQLERILQAAGLEKETHYKKQLDLKDEASSHFRPDYVIFLPDEKNLVIDSKVSLIAYERFYNAESEQDAKPFATEHVKNVKDHISRLSNVKYDQLFGINSPDYVIMYMPIEGALGLAMTEDSNLFEYALKRNIVLVSNNTLLATLKTVSFIWRQDLQNKNALEIARQGGALYDKFAGFVDTLKAIGKKMDGAREDYDKAMNQLYEGKGNLVRRSEQLKELGIKTTKQLPEK